MKHCAAANSRFFNQLKQARLGKDVFLTSSFEIAGDPFAIDKLILMILLFKEHNRGLAIHQFFNFSSLRILHVTTQKLTASGCCLGHMDDLGKNIFVQ